MKQKKHVHKIKSNKKTIGLATGGVAVTGVGALGVFGLCHLACQAVIAALAVFGITVVGMPLAFLNKPQFYIPFLAVGVISLGLSGYLWYRMRKKGCCK